MSSTLTAHALIALSSPNTTFCEKFWEVELPAMLSECYTDLTPSHILAAESSNDDWFAGAGVQRSVPQSPALERKSCRHCQRNLVMAQSCPAASRQPGAKALRCVNSNPNGFFLTPV